MYLFKILRHQDNIQTDVSMFRKKIGVCLRDWRTASRPIFVDLINDNQRTLMQMRKIKRSICLSVTDKPRMYLIVIHYDQQIADIIDRHT